MKLCIQSLLFLLWTTIICGVGYTFVITAVANFFWPKQSNGNLIIKDEKVLGSSIIAQQFNKPEYFWPRPSASQFNTLPSSATNFGPTSKKLQEKIQERKFFLAKAHETLENLIPEELLQTSASGLDPHITLKAALFQLDRIMKARKIDPALKTKLEEMIGKYKEKNIGFLNEDLVNVFLLNLALDEQKWV